MVFDRPDGTRSVYRAGLDEHVPLVQDRATGAWTAADDDSLDPLEEGVFRTRMDFLSTAPPGHEFNEHQQGLMDQYVDWAHKALTDEGLTADQRRSGLKQIFERKMAVRREAAKKKKEPFVFNPQRAASRARLASTPPAGREFTSQQSQDMDMLQEELDAYLADEDLDDEQRQEYVGGVIDDMRTLRREAQQAEQEGDAPPADWREWVRQDEKRRQQFMDRAREQLRAESTKPATVTTEQVAIRAEQMAKAEFRFLHGDTAFGGDAKTDGGGGLPPNSGGPSFGGAKAMQSGMEVPAPEEREPGMVWMRPADGTLFEWVNIDGQAGWQEVKK